MKNFFPLLWIFSVTILTISCKKNTTAPEPVNDGPGTISAVIDGQTHSFNYGENNRPKAWLEYIQAISNYRLFVYGQVENGYFRDHIRIEITSPNPIEPGSYSLSSASNISRPYIFYCPATVPFQNCHVSVNGIITITEMNSSYVKGTFNGILSYRDNSGTPRSNTLSNGKFNVNF